MNAKTGERADRVQQVMDHLRDKRLERLTQVRPSKRISIKLDDDVIDHYRATGDGWQTRINEILRREANLSP